MYQKSEIEHILFMLKYLNPKKNKKRIERYKKRLEKIQNEK